MWEQTGLEAHEDPPPQCDVHCATQAPLPSNSEAKVAPLSPILPVPVLAMLLAAQMKEFLKKKCWKFGADRTTEHSDKNNIN